MLLPAHGGLIDFFSMGTEKAFEAGRAQAELRACFYEAFLRPRPRSPASCDRLVRGQGLAVDELHRIEVDAALAARCTDSKNMHSVQTQHICLGQDAPIVPGTIV
jgi:hypothetical protein